MFKARSSARRLGWAALLGALPLAASACGLLIGLEDHQAFPGADAGEDANEPPDAPAVDAPDDGSEACPGALTMCNGICTDTTTSPTDCGECGNACPGLYACAGGVCGNRVEQISAGANHGCALVHDGSVWCWGNDQLGQLGTHAEADVIGDDSFPCQPTPARVTGLPAIAQVSAGTEATCALDKAGAVWCWGHNDSLQLGRASAMGAPIGFDPAPAPIPNLGQVAQVSMGYRFACARLVDTTVWCWGANELGGLGNGQMEGGAGGNLPAQIVGLKGNVSDVAAGLGGHACAVDVAGVVSCWGSNTFGQLGHDSLKDSKNCAMQACTSNPTSVAVQPAPGSKIALSSSGTCIEGDKGFRCWGGNLFGQFLTTPDGTPHPDPLAVALGADAVMSSYRGSYGTSCVITTAGSVRCWGDDSYGELGRGALITSPCAGNGTCDSTPGAVKLPTGFTPVQIATGAYWGMALSTKNRLVAWGANPDGRLGHAPGDGGDFKICGTTANAKDQRCNPTPLVIPHPGAAAP